MLETPLLSQRHPASFFDALVKTVLPTNNWSRAGSSPRFDCTEQKTIKKCWSEQLLFIGLIHHDELAFRSLQQAEEGSDIRWIDKHFLWWLLSQPELHSWLLSNSFLWLFICLRKKSERCGLTQQCVYLWYHSFPLSSCCLKTRWTASVPTLRKIPSMISRNVFAIVISMKTHYVKLKDLHSKHTFPRILKIIH